jgi:uncharacterized protein involved in tolerance to divalent cations
MRSGGSPSRGTRASLRFLAPALAFGIALALPLGGAMVRAAGAPSAGSATEEETAPSPVNLQELLGHLGEKAGSYEEVALKFICIETVRTGESSREERRYDYMYTEVQAQRYKPYRQKHTGKPGRNIAEAAVEIGFPDSYSWTLMFSPDRQKLFRFKYAGQEWFSLRQAHILEFTSSLPFSSGQTIYEWSGKVWVDSENYNFLKVEAEPGYQSERIKQELQAYRQAPRFLIFAMGKKPVGARYEITFLNDYQGLSLPDVAQYRSFTLDLQGQEELATVETLRYSGYQFFGVDVKDKFLK